MLKGILSFLVIIAGCADAIKYYWERQKIVTNRSSKDVSRKFVLAAIASDIVILGYMLYIHDFALIFIRFLSLWAMVDLWWFVYVFYPYQRKDEPDFKRPRMWTFLVNACLPNSRRIKL